jgi:hypothetical protein
MTFERSWRAFADEDAAVGAPAELEARILQAITTPQPQQLRPAGRIVGGLAAVAAMIIVTAWSMAGPKSLATADAPHLAAQHSSPFAAFAPTVVPEPAGQTRARIIRTATRNEEAPLEIFQLVRLRLPRQALATLGFLLVDPEATGVVDVDVLVGEDGWPRHIRKVWFEP